MELTADRAEEILARFAARRVLVVGDMTVDEHRIGSATRISREAPVPVIEQSGHMYLPGAAANLAFNVRALGADVSVAGLVGDDDMAARLRAMLDSAGVHTAGLIAEPARPTSVKLRVWAGGDRQHQHQQVARIDMVNRDPVSEVSQQELILYLEGAVPEYDGVLISDYESGVVDAPVLESLLPLAARHGKFVGADSHGQLHRFRGVDALTPNQPEAEAELGRSLQEPGELLDGGAELLRELDCRRLLITLGAMGMVVFDNEGEARAIPARPVAGVADTTGAGDTVAGVFTLSLLAGATSAEAAAIANLAGAIVVTKLGAATTSPDEILARLIEEAPAEG
ncbi:MAG: PfkB family carbohydrate kinase [Chloroflexota bacterium]|jgi:rfaE bifunctional protein kinase chain/domain|nr:PfkB family carbohydrate kinase [Chloroflexota bacterium]